MMANFMRQRTGKFQCRHSASEKLLCDVEVNVVREPHLRFSGFASKLDHARLVGWSLATKRHKKLKNQQTYLSLDEWVVWLVQARRDLFPGPESSPN
jgi:hypothetical protein